MGRARSVPNHQAMRSHGLPAAPGRESPWAQVAAAAETSMRKARKTGGTSSRVLRPRTALLAVFQAGKGCLPDPAKSRRATEPPEVRNVPRFLLSEVASAGACR